MFPSARLDGATCRHPFVLNLNVTAMYWYVACGVFACSRVCVHIWCQKWSSGVAHWLTQNVGGIKPLSPGYATFLAAPYLVARDPVSEPNVHVEATVPTASFGSISVDATAHAADSFTFTVSADTSAMRVVVGVRRWHPHSGCPLESLSIAKKSDNNNGSSKVSQINTNNTASTATGTVVVQYTVNDLVHGQLIAINDADLQSSVLDAVSARTHERHHYVEVPMMSSPAPSPPPGRRDVVVTGRYKSCNVDGALPRRATATMAPKAELLPPSSSSAAAQATPAPVLAVNPSRLYPFPPAQYPARSASVDSTTAGNWTGKYGAAGYVLYAFDDAGDAVERLPSFVKNITYVGVLLFTNW